MHGKVIILITLHTDSALRQNKLYDAVKQYGWVASR